MSLCQPCSLCPRECNADKHAGPSGYCRTSGSMSVATVFPHQGEEPVISGKNGICNVFFPHCNLQCIYCQNHQISWNQVPEIRFITTTETVIGQIEALLDRGITHVGFVSPSHAIRQMKAVIEGLKERGRRPIFVYNSNGYDKVETLKSLEGVIDIYLPDLKYMEGALSQAYSDAPDYPDAAKKALREMYRQKGSMLHLDENGVATSGLIIRHLILPNHIENSIACLKFIAEELSASVHLSLMGQYYPPEGLDHPLLNRVITEAEYQAVMAAFEDLGFYRGFFQEIQSAYCYRPDFSKAQSFE